MSRKEEKEAFFSTHPPKLYKYRLWDDKFHKQVLTNGELFFSSPKRFNDPYDCGLPFRQHPENSDPVIIKQMVEASVSNKFSKLTPEAREEKCAKQVLLIQQNPENWFEMNWGYTPEDLNQLFGVLSLTPHPNNYLMWSHYSSSHTGFCVEFDTRLLVESIAGYFQKVNYTTDIPFFSIRDALEDELLSKLIYTKSNIWEYEDEYRFSRIHKPDTPVKFNPDALTAVFFGCKTPYDHQIEIIEIVKKNYPKAVFQQMNLDSQKFTLTQGDLQLF